MLDSCQKIYGLLKWDGKKIVIAQVESIVIYVSCELLTVPECTGDGCYACILLLVSQAAPIALRSAKAAINEGLETDLASGMKVEEQQYAKVHGSNCMFCQLAMHRCLVHACFWLQHACCACCYEHPVVMAILCLFLAPCHTSC